MAYFKPNSSPQFTPTFVNIYSCLFYMSLYLIYNKMTVSIRTPDAIPTASPWVTTILCILPIMSCSWTMSVYNT